MSEYPKVFRNGKLVSKAKAEWDRPAAPYVISDNMDQLRHHGTGQVTDSKSEFRKMTKASGCIETGDQLPSKRQPVKLDRYERREDIQRTIYEIRNGVKR